jgi:hypothetical protein
LFQGKGLSGKVTFCGTVNAKNGFGGYAGMRPFIYFAEGDWAMLFTDPANDGMTVVGTTAFIKDCR